MIDHDRFAKLRLRHIISRDVLDAAPYLTEAPDEGPNDFDESYMGGSWSSEVINGVSFWYPKRSKGSLGLVQVSAGPQAEAVTAGPFVATAWAANANPVLAALEAGVQIGASLDAFRALAAGEVQVTDLGDGARQFVSLVSRSPDLYHLHGIVHESEGLIYLEVRRPDLIRRNEHEKGSYDECFGFLFDEG
jgi:hypothetical protein